FIQPEVNALAPQQLGVGSDLDDAPVLQHDDAVDVVNSVQPVRDDQRRSSAHHLPNAALDHLVGDRVHAGGGFVHNQHNLGIKCSRSSEGDQLFLADGEVGPTLS